MSDMHVLVLQNAFNSNTLSNDIAVHKHIMSDGGKFSVLTCTKDSIELLIPFRVNELCPKLIQMPVQWHKIISYTGTPATDAHKCAVKSPVQCEQKYNQQRWKWNQFKVKG